MVMVKMKVLVMMVIEMMIPMKSISMVMTMATISPLREGILSESFFSLGVLYPAEAAESISDPPSCLRFSGTTIYTRGRWQRWARVATPLGGVARA
jgi:hypothetical protein